MSDTLPRRLAAIVYADVAGYSRLSGEDEDATHRLLRAYLDLIAANVEACRGRVMHYAGDAVLAQFSAAVDALSCAVEIQTTLAERNRALPHDRQVHFRIGVNLGDVIEDRGDIYGDGVNVAARLESLATPGGICISESVHTTVGSKLPPNCQDIGEQSVKNIARPVRAYLIDVLPSGSESRKESSASQSVVSILYKKTAFDLPDRPSIAVLPFANMSGDPEQEFFSDGITEDIITDLARLETLFVVARNSTFRYKGQHVNVREVGQELGVRYFLEGSVRKSGERVRITAQLIVASSGQHLWAHRYDRDLQDIFAVQDEITRDIAAELEVKLVHGEQARAWHRSTQSPEAYELVLRGRELWRRFNRADGAHARQLMERALEIDPNFAYAMVMLGYNCVTHGLRERTDAPTSWFDQAIDLGNRALALDDSLGDAHAMLCQAFRYKGEHDRALTHGLQAVSLNPDSADANMYCSGGLLGVGRGAEAMEKVEAALRLNPFPPEFSLRFVGEALITVGRIEEAIAVLQTCVAGVPNMSSAHFWLTLAYMMNGQEEKGRKQAPEILRLIPDFSISTCPHLLACKAAETRNRFALLLRQAGLPE